MIEVKNLSTFTACWRMTTTSTSIIGEKNVLRVINVEARAAYWADGKHDNSQGCVIPVDMTRFSSVLKITSDWQICCGFGVFVLVPGKKRLFQDV